MAPDSAELEVRDVDLPTEAPLTLLDDYKGAMRFGYQFHEEFHRQLAGNGEGASQPGAKT